MMKKELRYLLRVPEQVGFDSDVWKCLCGVLRPTESFAKINDLMNTFTYS